MRSESEISQNTPQLAGKEAAVGWKEFRRPLENRSAVEWHRPRSGLETIPQWVGKEWPLTATLSMTYVLLKHLSCFTVLVNQTTITNIRG